MREQVLKPSDIASDSRLFRPQNRPPMAVLIALDDGSTDAGEAWRLRSHRCVIGRKTGDVIIPHDSGISGEHAVVTCELKNGAYVWHLSDLKSTNGTFLRVRKGALADGFQLMLGGKLYLFRARTDGTAATQPDENADAELMATRLVLRAKPKADFANALVEWTSAGEGQAFPIQGSTAWIGSDAKRCQIVIADDPFVSARHACIRVDSHGRWVINDADSLNGVWVRIDRVRLANSSEFQLGEQRFVFKLLTEGDGN
jgi:pSer/pThr/pTyr-binding forkhead associated (FHA) protein